MASTCPNCGKKLHIWNVKAECSSCGVSIPNFNWEQRLEEDNEHAEKAFGTFYRTLNRIAYSIWGTKLRIARLVLTFLPAIGFILPWATIKSDTNNFTLSIISFDKSKSLIDFFKEFFGDTGLFITQMKLEKFGGPTLLSTLGYLFFVLSALFIVIAFFMVLIKCKHPKTKSTIVFDVLSIASSVAAAVLFVFAGKAGSQMGAFSIGTNSAFNASGAIGWGYFVALALLLVAIGINIAVVKAPAKSDDQLEDERLAKKAEKDEKQRIEDEKHEIERAKAAKKAAEDQAELVENAKKKLAEKADKKNKKNK